MIQSDCPTFACSGEAKGSRKAWSLADAYERRIGRWSRLVASKFVEWLRLPSGLHWLDVGCGTGVLSQVVTERCAPIQITGVDISETQLNYGRARISDHRATFLIGDAQTLHFPDALFDAAVSGLLLNLLPSKTRAVTEMRRVVRPGGRIAAYVWDFAGEMQLMRVFWDEAIKLDSDASERDQGKLFPDCKPEPLAKLFMQAGVKEVETRTIEVPTVFCDFKDYWVPMTLGEGSIPDYYWSLSQARQSALRKQLQRTLVTRADGTIHLIARAWAVSGLIPR